MIENGTAPRHGHRTPSEIADDEVLAALRGETPDSMRRIRALPDRCKRVMMASRDASGPHLLEDNAEAQ